MARKGSQLGFGAPAASKPTMRMRISCLPIIRCHIFVKASPMAPRLTSYLKRANGCGRGGLRL